MTSLFRKRPPKHVGAAFCSVSEVEQHLADSEFNIGKIQEIQNKFAGGEILQVPGRVFVREGTLVKVCRKGPKKRQFFLFNDVLVYGCILPKNRYGNQHILPLSQMSVSDTCHYLPSVDYKASGDEHLEEELAFQLNHTDKSFHVFANSVADKNNWITNLRKNIAKASQGRNDDPLIVRAVWVPDSMTTACMQCEQKFTTFIRKHHCRQCGKVVCSGCSQNRIELRHRALITDASSKPERVCDGCYISLTQQSGQPPPPSVAANVVSNALLKQAGPHPSNHHENNSEESEDSDDSDSEVKSSVIKETSNQEVAKVTSGINKTVIEDPTPPPRRKKDQKRGPSMNKPPVVARTKKNFTQLHQDFAPSELLEQRKTSDVTMTLADDANNESDPVEKPRRRRKHFKSPDYVSQDEDHVSKGEADVASLSRDTVDSEIIVAATNNPDITDDDLNTTADINSAITDITASTTSTTDSTATTTASATDTDNVVDTITDELTTMTNTDHVITGDNQVNGQPLLQDVTTSSVKDSPVTRRKRKNKFKPKE